MKTEEGGGIPGSRNHMPLGDASSATDMAVGRGRRDKVKVFGDMGSLHLVTF